MGEITKSIAALHVEMRDGFWQRSTLPMSSIHVSKMDAEEYRLAAKRVELPSFVMVYLVGWVSKAEMYFADQETPPELQVCLTQISMEGMTWHWFKMLKEFDSQFDWDWLKRALPNRYSDHQSGYSFSLLKILQQQGSMDEFVEDFEVLAANAPHDQRQVHGILPLRIDRGRADGGTHPRFSRSLQTYLYGEDG